MATYRQINISEIQIETPYSSVLAQAWTNNLLAVTEGDATAPKISGAAMAVTSVETNWVMARIAAGAFDAIGSYVFAQSQTAVLGFGTIYAGSGLRGCVINGNVSSALVLTLGSTLSGSWMACGGGGQSGGNATLFKRVA